MGIPPIDPRSKMIYKTKSDVIKELELRMKKKMNLLKMLSE